MLVVLSVLVVIFSSSFCSGNAPPTYVTSSSRSGVSSSGLNPINGFMAGVAIGKGLLIGSVAGLALLSIGKIRDGSFSLVRY